MLLEDLHGAKVGDFALLLPDETMVSAAFHHHAVQAQWHTLNCLLRIGGENVDGAANERIAVVEWWRTLESLIALTDAVALYESDQGLRNNSARYGTHHKVMQRWAAVAKWFSGDTDSAPSESTDRLKALRNFRNSFEHNSHAKKIKVQHSRLGSVPAFANLADAMEAMAICVEASGVIRHVLTGLDLMPNVLVPSKKHAFFMPLDELASGVILPQYRRVVKALGLESAVDLYPPPRPLNGRSEVVLQMVVKARPDEFDRRLDESLGLWSHFEAFAELQPFRPAPDQFSLPRYSLRQAHG
jgi:hypothetical protein